MSSRENKTKPSDQSVSAFLDALEPDRKRSEALTLDDLFRRVTGWTPVIWGGSMIGYGRYDYVYKSGHSGSFFATGFAPRKSAHSLYIMPGYQDMDDLLAQLGKHRHGKSCLYLTNLKNIDLDVLEAIIARGLEGLHRHYPVFPT